MIQLENISKTYHTRSGKVPVLKNVNLTVREGERLGVLGMNGAGKSTLIRLVSGVERPTAGRIQRDMSISWPLAFGGAFLGMLTGLDNFRFISRLYNVDPEEKIDFVREFAELGPYFNEPLKNYSSGMRARLAFAISMAVEFDCFLIDEIVAVGDARFQEKCNYELFERRGDRAFFIVSHHADFIRKHCNTAAVLIEGHLHHYASIDEAYAAYNAHLADSTARASVGAKTTVAMPINQPEKDREEAMMEQQISGLSNLVAHALEQKLDDQTISVLVRSFTSDTVEPSVFLGVINHLRIRGDLRSATKFAEFVVRDDAPNSLYGVALGDLYYIQSDDRKAIGAFSQAVEHDAYSFWAQRNLGLTYFKLGCYEECLPHFTAAMRLSTDPAQRRELVWFLIDAYTYLDRLVPDEIHAEAKINGTEFIELTPIWYPAHKLLRVRAFGFLEPTVALEDISCEFAIGDEVHPPTEVLFGTNSIRRYAQQAGTTAFGVNLYISLPEIPEAMEFRLYGATKPTGMVLRAPKPLALARSSIDVVVDGRAPLADWSIEEGYAALGDRMFLVHDNELACAYYGLAHAAGSRINSERYVEALIALGRFNEAEWHLKSVFDRNSPEDDLLGEYGGKLFDLYCAEIARSRVEGWDSRIEQLVADRLSRAPDETAGLTNLGHMQVHRHQLSDAIESYTRAVANARGREIIHFASGITSARYAGTVPPVAISDVGAPPEIDRIVHLFSCDAKYFKRYGQAVVSSSARAAGAENVFIHAHIVDPDVEALALARKLQATYKFEVTTEFFPLPDAPYETKIAYYTSARFINAEAIMQLYGCPVLITETDCQIKWDWNEIRAWCAGSDYGSALSNLWNWVPWTRIPAGIVYFDNHPKGLSIARFIHTFLMRVFGDPKASEANLWTVDQVALWLAWERFNEHVSTCNLPMTSILTLAVGDKSNILDDER